MSAGIAGSATGESFIHTTSTPASVPSPSSWMISAPGMPASLNGPSSDAGPWPRAASMASSNCSSRASEMPAAPRMSRYSSSRATGDSSNSDAASAIPGTPRPEMSAWRNTRRESRSRASPDSACAIADSTSPHGRSAGMTMTGTAGDPEMDAREMAATTPSGTDLPMPLGATSRPASAAGAAGSSSTSAATVTPSAPASGTSTAPSSAGSASSSERGRPATAVVPVRRDVRERVLTPGSMTHAQTRHKPPWSGVCPHAQTRHRASWPLRWRLQWAISVFCVSRMSRYALRSRGKTPPTPSACTRSGGSVETCRPARRTSKQRSGSPTARAPLRLWT